MGSDSKRTSTSSPTVSVNGNSFSPPFVSCPSRSAVLWILGSENRLARSTLLNPSLATVTTRIQQPWKRGDLYAVLKRSQATHNNLNASGYQLRGCVLDPSPFHVLDSSPVLVSPRSTIPLAHVGLRNQPTLRSIGNPESGSKVTLGDTTHHKTNDGLKLSSPVFYFNKPFTFPMFNRAHLPDQRWDRPTWISRNLWPAHPNCQTRLAGC